VLDFGDLSETYAVAEVAIALTYALLLEMSCQEQTSKSGDELDFVSAFAAGKALLKGYQKIQPLEADELQILSLLIIVRYVGAERWKA
jgi:Ser/Thr protein kinase RdoA (MazF antagonist)